MKNMDSLTEEIRRGIRGELIEEIDEKYCTDFSRSLRKTPLLVVRVTCEEDVIHVMKTALYAGVPVTVRGAGKSCHGQSLNEGGILIENFLPESPVNFIDDDCVEVNTRSRWYELERGLNKAGRSAPVLTDYLNLSVGGTLSVGGIGVDSIRHGFQVDQLKSVRLILPNGTMPWCSPEENQELFRFGPAGIGQAGFMDKVIMKTGGHRKYCYLYKVQHKSFSELLAFIKEILEEPGGIEHFNAWIVHKMIVSEIGFYRRDNEKSTKELRNILFSAKAPGKILEESIQEDYKFKLSEEREAWLNYFPDHIRLWTDYIFDYDALVQFVDFLKPLMKVLPLSKALQANYILIIRRPGQRTDFVLSPAPKGKHLIGIGLFNMVSKWNLDLLWGTIEILKTTLNKCQELGGRPYLYGWNDLDEHMKRDFYGDDYERLLELRKKMNLDFFNSESF